MFLEQVFKGLNDWWRYLIGIAIVMTGYFVGQVPLFGGMMYYISKNHDIGSAEMAQFVESMDFEALGMSKNLGFFLLLFMFIMGVLALWMVIRQFHNRSFKSLITPRRDINYKKILMGFGVWLALGILMEGINFMVNPSDYTFRFAGGSFFVLLLMAVFLLPIQTSFEELFFRGYIMQGLYSLKRNKWMAVLISSVLFGMMHGMNPEISEYGWAIMMTYYILAGMFLAIITILDDSLELALGVHAATNFIGLTLFTYEGSVLQTDTLFVSGQINPVLMTITFAMGAFVFIALGTKFYGWKPIMEAMKDGNDEWAAGQNEDLTVYTEEIQDDKVEDYSDLFNNSED